MTDHDGHADKWNVDDRGATDLGSTGTGLDRTTSCR